LPWQPFLAFYIWGAHWRLLKNATYVQQGNHHVGHWPTFLVLCSFLLLIIDILILFLRRAHNTDLPLISGSCMRDLHCLNYSATVVEAV